LHIDDFTLIVHVQKHHAEGL